MSDRTTPEVFRVIFMLLAKNPTEEHVGMAREIWKCMGDFDFHPRDLHCERSLVRLELCGKAVDKEYPQDGKVWHYGPKGKCKS